MNDYHNCVIDHSHRSPTLFIRVRVRPSQGQRVIKDKNSRLETNTVFPSVGIILVLIPFPNQSNYPFVVTLL